MKRLIRELVARARRRALCPGISPARLRLLVALVWAAGLTGCMIGPDFQRPPAPIYAQWNQPMGQGLVDQCAGDCAWWSTFEDVRLDRFLAQTVSANLTLREAGMRVVAARAARGVVAGNLWPTVAIDASYARRKSSGNGGGFGGGGPEATDLWAAGFDTAWELDFFGRLRRAVEAADNEVAATIEDYRGVVVSLLAETASAYVDVRMFENRIALAYENLGTQERTLKLTVDRFNAGDVGELDVAQARANVNTTKSDIPLLEIGLQLAKNRLCVLRGEPPRNIDAELGPKGEIPIAQRDVAVCVPAELLRRRPDIRRAEYLVAAQNARIGVAMGEWYPQFTLTGTVGVAATDISRLFTSNSLNYSYGPNVHWNILQFGRIRNNVALQRALTEQLVYTYQQTVLLAVEEVETAMVNTVQEKQRAVDLAAAVVAAQRAVELSEIQYRGGLINFQTVLDSQRALLILQDRLSTSRGTVARNVIAIYRALGGGWEVPVPMPPVDGVLVEPVRPGEPEPVERPAPVQPNGAPQPNGAGQPNRAQPNGGGQPNAGVPGPHIADPTSVMVAPRPISSRRTPEPLPPAAEE